VGCRIRRSSAKLSSRSRFVLCRPSRRACSNRSLNGAPVPSRRQAQRQAKQIRLPGGGLLSAKRSGTSEEFQSPPHPYIRGERVSACKHPLHLGLPGKDPIRQACSPPPARQIQNATLPGLWIPAGRQACL